MAQWPKNEHGAGLRLRVGDLGLGSLNPYHLHPRPQTQNRKLYGLKVLHQVLGPRVLEGGWKTLSTRTGPHLGGCWDPLVSGSRFGV